MTVIYRVVPYIEDLVRLENKVIHKLIVDNSKLELDVTNIYYSIRIYDSQVIEVILCPSTIDLDGYVAINQTGQIISSKEYMDGLVPIVEVEYDNVLMMVLNELNIASSKEESKDDSTEAL